MADHGPISPSGPGSSKFRDVTRTVSTEAATHLDRLKKSERTKQVVDKTVDWTADRLKAQASKLWSEDEKVKAFRDRTREMVENALEDEEKMQRVRLPRFDRPADPNVFLPAPIARWDPRDARVRKSAGAPVASLARTSHRPARVALRSPGSTSPTSRRPASRSRALSNNPVPSSGGGN